MPPTGVSTAHASVAPSAYSTAAARSTRSSRGSRIRHAAQKIGIDRYAVNGNGAQPPSGKAIDRSTGGSSPAAAIASPSRLLVPIA